MTDGPDTYRTKTGRVLTDADIQALADEAERGYDAGRTGSALLLSGIVGSVAYGLATPDSDTDRLGVFAVPTMRLLGLHPPAPTRHGTAPDYAHHEAGKFLMLALKCNPTVTELLWLPDELYEVRTPLGEELIAIRSCLLSREYVRNAYLGYATQQLRRLESPECTMGRKEKHARHLWRLVQQGVRLWLTGTLYVQLDPDAARNCREFGTRVAAGDAGLAAQMTAWADAAMEQDSALPEHPDEEKAEAWLLAVRRAFWEG